MSGNTSATGGYIRPTSVLPADDDALDTILHDFLVGVTGLANTLVFPRWQPQQPTFPSVTINWAAIGVTHYEPTGEWPAIVHFNGYSVLQQHQIMHVLATFYGPNSGSYASRFLDGMLIRQNWDVLNTSGIKLRRVGNLSNVPELVNTQWVGRNDVSCEMIRQIDRTIAIQNVASSETDITTDDPLATIVVQVP